MTYALYDIVTSCAVPVGAIWLALHPQYHPLFARFSPHVPAVSGPPLWVQACSVGEVGTAKPLVKSFAERHPEVPVLLTTSTVSGHALARSAGDRIHASWFPFDHKFSVRRFLSRANPRALVLLETELWPNVLRETRRRGVPVVLLNGRLSDRHLARYRRFRRLLQPVLRHLSVAGMQNQEYADRIAELGVPREVIHITGNTKFDGVVTDVPPHVTNAVRQENGLGDAPILLFGSTRPGDEALAARCWSVLRDEFPALRLVIAPRHPERVDEAVACFNEPVLRRSHVKQGRRPQDERVFVLDTVGELIPFYAVAALAVVGGSFYPGVNGHNPLEPAALAVPTVFGPYMRNFIDPARVLVACDGARQVGHPGELLPTLRALLEDADARRAIAARGREGVLANQGAIQRSLDLLDSVLDAREA